MIEIKNKEMCSGCAACASICPKCCIEMVLDEPLGFLYPKVDTTHCIDCGRCEAICPNLKRKEEIKADASPMAYLAIAKNDDIRAKSSSGGIFTAIAEHILSRGGVVFGAVFDDTYHAVKHIAVETVEDLARLRGSKYLQSNVKDTYAQAKRYLEAGRLVLFSGTPCQIDGLRAYLGKDYEHLYLQDLICHGAPSPAVWDAYLSSLEKRMGEKATAVSFRDKRIGWKAFSLSVDFGNGRSYTKDHPHDPYMLGFLGNYYLRPSCYACMHKDMIRNSDITLADCWGIEKICPEMDDNKGTSLVIISSEKGQKLFEQVAEHLNVRETELLGALKYNPAMIRSAVAASKREVFEKEFSPDRVNTLLKKHCRTPLTVEIKRKVKRLLRKMLKPILK